MFGFKRIGPQRVRHRSGFEVMSASRHRVGYIAEGRTATAEAEMTNRVVPVYASTLTWSDTGEPLTADERSVVGPRMVAGLRAMWIRAKLLD